MPSSILGQRNLLPSGRLASRHTPVPSQKSTSRGPPAWYGIGYARERIGLELFLHQRREAIHAFADGANSGAAIALAAAVSVGNFARQPNSAAG